MRPGWAKGFGALALAGLVLVGAAGCGDDDDAPETTGTEAAAGPVTTDAEGCELGPEVTAADAPEVDVAGIEPPTEVVTDDLTVGTGSPVAAGDAIELQYTGALLDGGEEFDSSWDDLSPLPFTAGAGEVIPGFDEGVLGMQVGGRRQIVIPADQAYGDQGAGDAIPPGADLVFVVDLVKHCPAGGSAASDPGATGSGVVLPPGPDGATIEGATPCPADDGSEERVAVFAEPPPMCITEGEPLEAEIAVSATAEDGSVEPAGTIVVALDTEAAPVMANNFVVLSRYRFYDGIPFHRLVPDFVAQVGGSGAPGPGGEPDYATTGPGYDMPDVESPTDGYQVGDVAMARAQEVSGSQLFIVTSEAGLAALDQASSYPRFGRVTEGLDLAVEMADSGTADGAPTILYTIDAITIRPA